MTLRAGALALCLLTLAAACATSTKIESREEVVELEAPDADAAPAQDPVQEATFPDGPYDGFSGTRAMRHVRRLAGEIGVRVRATRGEYRASRYVARRFRDLGYDVQIQEFSVDNRTSRNVIASWPGSNRYGFVVGGHMDTASGSPGANDNASGTAVVLEMARIFAGKRPSKFVRFAAFGSEEYGSNRAHHVGSQVYVNRLGREGRAKLAGMTSVDMVADGRPLLVGNSGIASDVVARSLYRRIRDAGIAVRYHVLCDCSDHGPFEHAGIPASFAYSGTEPDNHDPSDTVSNVKPRHLHRSGRAMRAFLKVIDGDMLQRFRRNR